MATDLNRLRSALDALRVAVLGDRKIDLTETHVLLDFAKEHEKENAKFADLVKLLEAVREDGIIEKDESEKLEMHLDWLVREFVETAPETGFLGKLFKFNRNRTSLKTEIIAGFTTFMAMAYILAVNPNFLSTTGMSKGGVMIATALAAFVGTMLMASLTNYPFVLAAGMGLNAYFAFTVCGDMGYSWQFALLAVFVEGLVFLALSLTKVREGIFNAIPFTLKKAVSVGIGLFITLIALKCAGILVPDQATFIKMIPFTKVPFDKAGIQALLAIAGVVITGFMVIRKVPGAILLGILVTWALGIGAEMTGLYMPDVFCPHAKYFSTVPHFGSYFSQLGDSFHGFGQIFCGLFDPVTWTHSEQVVVEGVKQTFTTDPCRVCGNTLTLPAMHVTGSGSALALSLNFFVVMFAFFFVDLFDTLGTLIGVSMKGGFLDKEGKLPRISGALCADSIATSVGAVLGTSTTTTYVESASGVMAGGRTGLTAIVAALLFLASIALAPLFLAIPAFATAPALVIVGFMMMSAVMQIDFNDPTEGIPAFCTIFAMPFFYSISDGIMWGVITYTALNLLGGNFRRIHWIMYVLTVVFVLKYALM